MIGEESGGVEGEAVFSWRDGGWLSFFRAFSISFCRNSSSAVTIGSMGRSLPLGLLLGAGARSLCRASLGRSLSRVFWLAGGRPLDGGGRWLEVTGRPAGGALDAPERAFGAPERELAGTGR